MPSLSPSCFDRKRFQLRISVVLNRQYYKLLFTLLLLILVSGMKYGKLPISPQSKTYISMTGYNPVCGWQHAQWPRAVKFSIHPPCHLDHSYTQNTHPGHSLQGGDMPATHAEISSYHQLSVSESLCFSPSFAERRLQVW